MTRSHDLFAAAQRHIPGGVNSPVRAFRGVGGDPVFFESAEGPYLFDIEGKRYIDYVGSWGPMILGHAHPLVIEAVADRIHKGLSFGAPTELETRMADKVCELVPSMDLVRMVSSGTEATMSAIRLARGYTGRDKLVKFEGCYHGHSDSLLVKAGSGALTLGEPSSPGVPAGSGTGRRSTARTPSSRSRTASSSTTAFSTVRRLLLIPKSSNFCKHALSPLPSTRPINGGKKTPRASSIGRSPAKVREATFARPLKGSLPRHPTASSYSITTIVARSVFENC